MRVVKPSSWSPTLSIFVCVAVAAACLATACDRDGASEEDNSEAVVPADEDQTNASDRTGADEESDEHAHDHGEGEVHIADAMYELSRRSSAIWFAGQVGNREMVDYQIHEIEELHEELAEASPTENGIDVAARLKSDVVEPLEELSAPVADTNLGDFESGYEEIMTNCETCHADTGHDFINLKKPEYNPYPNLDMTPE